MAVTHRPPFKAANGSPVGRNLRILSLDWRNCLYLIKTFIYERY
jgi:hypothetical protein